MFTRGLPSQLSDRVPPDRVPPDRILPDRIRLLALLPFGAAFFYGPIAFGGTTPETSSYLDWLIGHGFLAWLFVLVGERRLPRPPLAAVAAAGVLVVIGVLQIANPRSFVDPVYGDLTPLPGHIPWLPGSVDVATTGPALRHTVVLLLGGLALADLCVDSNTRWRMLRWVALSGFVVAVIGIWQKASGAEAMLWTTPERSGRNFFCAYRYHANAASFLNLAWPAAFAVWMRSRIENSGSVAASLKLCAFLLTVAAVFVNSSKAGQMLGLLGMSLVVWRFRGELFANAVTRSGAVVLGVFLLLLSAVLVLPGLVTTLSKWNELAADGGSLKGRLYAYNGCIHALSESGWFGTGAATFQHIFPYHTLHLGDLIEGFWLYAHQDYLQTLIEWGWIGGAAWAVIVGGAVFRLAVRVRGARRQGIGEITSTISLLALGLVLLHALADFPLQIPSIQWLFAFYVAQGWLRTPWLSPESGSPGPERTAAPA